MTQSWHTILAEAGFPTDVVVLDWETYFDSDYSLRKLSTIEYVTDPRFEELGLAWLRQQPGKPPAVSEFSSKPHEVLDWLTRQYGGDLGGCTVVIQNAIFDGSILAHHYGIQPRYVVDTLGLARHINPRVKNDLKTLAERYGLKAKGDTTQFKGLRYDAWTDEQFAALTEYATGDTDIEWALFCKLLPYLSRPKVELPLMVHTLRLFWQPCLGIDFDAGEKLVADMKTEVDNVLKPLGLTKKQISGTNSFRDLITEALGDEAPPLKQAKKGDILAIAKADEGLTYLLNHPKPQVRQLIQARVAVKSWPLHIARVQRIMDQARAAGGVLPVPLKYCGAHTARWSGAERINLQNLSARSPHKLVQGIRGLIVAPESHRLVVADAAQIEARGTAWIAGQDDLLEAFESGRDPYVELASEICGRKLRKARKDDPPPVGAFLSLQRTIGKIGTLGCGFGMGKARCLEYAHDVYHVDIDAATAEAIVKRYRARNRAICKFWNDIEAAFKFVTKYPHERKELPRGLAFWREDDTTTITLPSGRNLRYPGAMVVPDTDRWGRLTSKLYLPDPAKAGLLTPAWGGVLTENVVQAISRDVLGEAILLCEAAGVHVAHHCHDELIGMVHVDWAEDALAIMLNALRTRPAWAPGWPLDAEGFVTERYGKQ